MLAGEHASRAPEAGGHLVDAEERPVSAAELLRPLQVARLREDDAVPDDRLGEKQRHVLAAQLLLDRAEVVEGHAGEAGKERLEAVGEGGVAVRRERSQRQPVEAVLDGDDARSAGRRPPELDRRLDRLGTRAREESAAEARRRAAQQLLRQQSRPLRDAEGDAAGQLEVEPLVQRRPHARVRAADVVHPEPAEQVEEAVAVRVVEVRTLAARPAAVEADRPQHAHELRVDEPRVELELLALVLCKQVAYFSHSPT